MCTSPPYIHFIRRRHPGGEGSGDGVPSGVPHGLIPVPCLERRAEVRNPRAARACGAMLSVVRCSGGGAGDPLSGACPVPLAGTRSPRAVRVWFSSEGCDDCFSRFYGYGYETLSAVRSGGGGGSLSAVCWEGRGDG